MTPRRARQQEPRARPHRPCRRTVDTRLALRVRADRFGLRLRADLELYAWDPHQFVDEQLHGPFASRRHEHLFAPRNEATMMVDQIEFRSPSRLAGAVVDRAVLRRYTSRIVEQRNSWLKTTLESGPPVPMR